VSALLTGKRGVVTGAAQGIGAATAEAVATAGAEVVLCDRDPAVRVTAERLGMTSALLDVTDPDGVAQTFAEVTADGPVDFLVNNAGIRLIKPLNEVSLAEWRQVFSVNLDGPFLCTRAVLPTMLAAGGGAIVNIASVAGILAFRDRAAYNATKGAIMAFTRSVAAEHAADGIRCNAVAPGVVETPLTASYFTDEVLAARIRQSTPAGRWAQPAEIAGPVVFLLSDLATFVSGHTLVVDGGWCAAKGY
jgi:gluconate 5-dehydrogenase